MKRITGLLLGSYLLLGGLGVVVAQEPRRHRRYWQLHASM